MNRTHATVVCLMAWLGAVACGVLGCSSRGPTSNQTGASAERIGVYDSRAIAVAYIGGEQFNRRIQPLVDEAKKAKSDGNEARYEELTRQIRQGQDTLHRQGFGTAPVDDILATIQDDLPAIEKQAGVAAIVSKWDDKALAEHKSVEQVDVTMLLVDALKPDPEQRKAAEEIQQKKPVPAKELESLIAEGKI